MSKSFFIAESNKTKNIINKLHQSMLNRYEHLLENAMEGIDYAFNHLTQSNMEFHKVSIQKSVSYIQTPERIAIRKATVNPQSKNKNVFNTQLLLHFTLKKLVYPLKEFQKSHYSLLDTIEIILNSLQNQKTVKHLKQLIIK